MYPPGSSIVNIVSAQQHSQMLAIASLCLLVYDILITLDQEVEYMWKHKPYWVPIKVLFALNRWMTPVVFGFRIMRFTNGSLTADGCFNLFVFTQIAQIFTVTIVEIAMALRVWALYHQSRRAFMFLTFLIIAATTHGIVTNTISLYVAWTSKKRTAEQPYLAACNRISAHFPNIYNTIFYPPLVLEVIFFSMTISQVIRYGWISSAPLLSHVRHNGIKFFSLALAAILFAVAGAFFPATRSAARNSNFAVAILSMNCSRLILSLRGAFSENSLNRSTQNARDFVTRTNGIPHQLTELNGSELGRFDGFQNDSSSFGGDGSAYLRLGTIQEESSHPRS